MKNPFRPLIGYKIKGFFDPASKVVQINLEKGETTQAFQFSVKKVNEHGEADLPYLTLKFGRRNFTFMFWEGSTEVQHQLSLFPNHKDGFTDWEYDLDIPVKNASLQQLLTAIA